MRGSLLVIAWTIVSLPAAAAEPNARPTMAELMGLCTHTVQFRPQLYQPICAHARDYHPIDWDTGEDPATPTTLPMARNRVDWMSLYGGWVQNGFDVDASLMFDQMPTSAWRDPEASARSYGEAFARALGPTAHGPVSSVEIGNEPGRYPDALYRSIFSGMAAGLRAGDPRLRIATCAADAGAGGDYCKSLACVRGLEPLYDIITMHTYAMLTGWPTWRPSFPEDARLDYLACVRAVLAWRDDHAPGKEVWITEFGWDAGSHTVAPSGDFAQWEDATETEQARYLVRSYLLFAAMGVDRAYLFWFNDEDQPQLHGSKGLTRHWQPKPAYHAVAHLRRTLGDYRFARILVDRPGDCCVYEFAHAHDAHRVIWVAWSPTASDRRRSTTIASPSGVIDSVECMPLGAGKAEATEWTLTDRGVTLDLDGAPTYLIIHRP